MREDTEDGRIIVLAKTKEERKELFEEIGRIKLFIQHLEEQLNSEINKNNSFRLEYRASFNIF